MKNIRSQGDVTFIPVENVKRGQKIADGVIARGEVTGHCHAIADLARAELYQCEDGMYMEVGEKGVSITHQEHGTVVLEPGKYRINIDKQYDYFSQALRNVAD